MFNINAVSALALFRLSEALKGQRKNAEADDFRQKFEWEWQAADVEINRVQLLIPVLLGLGEGLRCVLI